RRPELLEVVVVARRDRRGVDGDDDVLLARPRVGCPIGRTGPDGSGVADDVLVVHEVGYSRDRGGRERLRLERVGIGLRRRRDRYGFRVIEVVGETDGDTALLRGDELAADDRVELRRQLEVVDRDFERLLRGAAELGEG